MNQKLHGMKSIPSNAFEIYFWYDFYVDEAHALTFVHSADIFLWK